MKSHLKETIPSIIVFYEYNNSKNLALMESTLGGVGVNKAQLYKEGEIIELDKNHINEKENVVKNISMRLAEDLMHECFGHKKFQLHHIICYKQEKSTPIKCFDNKQLKELVPVMNYKTKYINILSNDEGSDSGNYFESSFGKLEKTRLYTFSFLKLIKNKGKLLDNPLLFTDKNNLEKLQKYVYYKFLYEFKNKDNNIFDNLSFEEEYKQLINMANNKELKIDNSNNEQDECTKYFPYDPKKNKDQQLLSKKRKRKTKNVEKVEKDASDNGRQPIRGELVGINKKHVFTYGRSMVTHKKTTVNFC